MAAEKMDTVPSSDLGRELIDVVHVLRELGANEEAVKKVVLVRLIPHATEGLIKDLESRFTRGSSPL